MGKKVSWLHLAAGILFGLSAIAAATVFGACPVKDDGTWMRCHEAETTVVLLMSALAVYAVSFGIATKKLNKCAWFVLLADAVGAAVSVMVSIIPGVIMPLCMRLSMRCYTVFQPFVKITAVVGALLFVADFVLSEIKLRRSRRTE